MKNMGRSTHLLFGIIFTTFYFGNGCQIDGVTNWLIPVSESIVDTFRGTVFSRSTSNIEAINSVNFFEGLNGGPYLDVSFSNSQFNIVTNAAYADYEENETAESFSFTIIFRCTGGTTSTLVFLMNILDTNNNAPQFMPSSNYEFTIAPPIPPGFLVTGCFNDITVRDIDLTTQRIDYEIEDNQYFEIEYDATSSTVPKEFKATLKTTSFIRSIPEPITLRITATDVDLTGDPRLQATATIKIIGDSEFEFPEEPVFSQTFYLANYTEDHRLIVHDTITLQQGYDNQVTFSLEGEYSSSFGLVANVNQISLSVETPLPDEVLTESQIFIVLRADRQYTTGDTATVVVQLPEEPILEFERAYYEGSIINNSLQLSQLTLIQGYDASSLSVNVISEYSSYFSVAVQGNQITLTMSPLADSIIEENNFLNLQVSVTAGRSFASAIITLEIIKDDKVTPVFNKPIFTGTYDSATGLSIEQIIIVQGYDETVSVYLEGEHASYFQIAQSASAITLTSSIIPPEMFSEQRILLSVEATKPRTVGANAAVVITLPAARELRFQAPTYRGSVRDNVLILETITLSVGYEENINFALTGDHASYFTISNVQNQVSILLTTVLPADFVIANNNIILTLTASGLNAVSNSATIIIEIIKNDLTTPIFNQNIYYGTHSGTSNIEIGNINLVQGFDETVTFRIEGDHSQYFGISNAGNSVLLSLQSAIPEEVIFNEKVLSFNIRAEKDLTVGANAVILIRFPSELTEPTVLRFNKKNYVGSIENDKLSLENMVLDTGFTTDTDFSLNGEYSSYFSLTTTSNTASVSLLSVLPDTIIKNNSFILLGIEARRERAISTFASVIIDIIKEDFIPPVFSKPYYSGVYTEDAGLLFEDEISLALGYDETVTFTLEGDTATLFSVVKNGNSLTILAPYQIPETILQNNNQLIISIVANKPNVVSGRSAVIIDLPKDVPDLILLRFEQSSYVGTIHNDELQIPAITLTGNYSEAIHVDIVGDYASFFTLSIVNNIIGIKTNGVPVEVINENIFIILGLEASLPEAVTGFTTVVIEILKDTEPQVVTPLFERVYYTGEYGEESGFIFNNTITLIQGFNDFITFSLSGDDSQWFTLLQNAENSFTLAVKSTPQTTNRSHFIFSIVAEKPGSLPGHAAVVISITDISTNIPLRFSQDFYSGSIENDNLVLEVIKLEEGYSTYMTYSLIGDYSDYFQLTEQDGIFTVLLTTLLPVDVLEANNILIFTLQVQDENTRAHTTIVLELISSTESEAMFAFEETYYVGSYSETSGFHFNQQIRLKHESNETIQFSLSGDYNEFFAIINSGEYISIIKHSPLPSDIMGSNHQLIFTIEAQNSRQFATATIVISLLHDVPNFTSLIFDEVFYTGIYTKADELTFAKPVSLSAGYDHNVLFALEGDDSQWFGVKQSENSVELTLLSPIPAAVLANNQFLIFVISAQRVGSAAASATIVISLKDEYTENNVLGFNRVTYIGSIENNIADIQTITLSEGYTQDVTFTLHGEMVDYFQILSDGPDVTISLQTAIPEESIPANGFTLLYMQATAPSALTAHATIVFEFVREHDLVAVELTFNETFYTGTYTEANGLTFANPVSLSAGYDQSVVFVLEGDDSQWFGVKQSENSVELTLLSPIPAAVLANNQFLIFVISAQRVGSVAASATIVISLKDEYTENNILGFNRVTYVGSIENNIADIQTITLSEGYTQDVTFTLHGEMVDYFQILSDGPDVTISLQTAIPEESIPANGFTLLYMQATAPSALTAHATIVFEFVREHDLVAVELTFNETFYTGTYTEANGLTFANPVSLSAGYDQSVVFVLEGDDSQWFGVKQSENSVELTLLSPIPAAVLANNQFLIFVISAQRVGSAAASATIVISLKDEYTENNVLGFNRVTYIGSIENNIADIQTITLSEGYTQDVTFTLHGEMVDYFQILSDGPDVTISLQTAIPEESIPANGFTLLYMQATAPSALTAHATIVFEFVREHDLVAVELTFNETFYTGTYTEANGLTFANPVSLSAGYDQSVVFVLEGDDSQWFGVKQSENSVELTLLSPIPAAVLANNQFLIFVISAQRVGSAAASATIVISLKDEYTENNVLGFNRVTYIGSIENNIADIQTITLSEGYTQDVTFTLHGEMVDYFQILSDGPDVTISLQTAIPEESIPANGFTLLYMQATAPSALTAHATIVFEFVREHDLVAVELTFNETFYTGTYTEANGLTFANPVSLSAGYDQSVVFVLEGDDSQWFGVKQSENSVELMLLSPIPAAMLANNQFLIFVISAQRVGSAAASATIVISLKDEYTENNVLGFNRVTYVGSIENNIADIQTITLSEGYTQDVTFTLHGEMVDYFQILSDGPDVTISLQTAIPEESIPANGFTLLYMQATAPSALTAHATIVFEFVREHDLVAVELTFNETFYTGTYTEANGLTFANPVSLSAGYDQSVVFVLEGDDSQWFGVKQSENSVELMLLSPIPAAVLANNQFLIFVISAQRVGSAAASATIVISLKDEYTENNVLGFNRVTYVGSIENNIADIQTITLSEGYTQDVTFTLHGEMVDYFQILSDGPDVTISLQTAIPEESIPANGFTLLYMQATAPSALTAHATIVFEFVREHDLVAVELTFNETFYTGTYTEANGLTFANPVSLSAGYDQSVVFVLEGDDSQWFGVKQSENSVELTLLSPIPAAVLANNQFLIFVISAQRVGSAAASATIVISLKDEYTENNVLGFNRVTYVGSIENNIADIQTITLSEGYTQDVTFTLHGEMVDYFQILSDGPDVTISLQTAIPEESIPANGFTLLYMQATAPSALTAHATIVFEFVREHDLVAVELTFNETFYTGTYTEANGLTFANPVSLSAGYDQSVSFALDGEQSHWFQLVVNGNSVSLILATPIPNDALLSYNHLIFVITAQRPGSSVARATIVITIDDGTYNEVTFGKVLYEGLIQIGAVQHESITISRFSGTSVQLLGEYASAFTSHVYNGVVTIQATGAVTLPASVTLVVLEMHADGASAVLLLKVVESENPVLPSVSFGSASYALRVGIDETGLIGRVEATADNGESLVYSLLLDNAHLQSRISINNEGEIHLFAPAASGVYSFQVVATTIITQVSGSASVYLSIEAIATCGDNDLVVPPLIILNRDEEESHNNLVVINGTQLEGCRYTLVNRWPVNQTWLYVDDNGLHTRPIDREHESIAFMALSQVQVELILHCDSDPTTRTKRSIETETANWLGPYDYGTKNWILTDTISYNSRRSFVNLIVNDINDNSPIFIEKENEPIVVGYPVPELENTVLPRSLAELQATDADIGENAALMYWSSEVQLAVSPLTGFVHVRDGAKLEHDARLTVNVTDRNGSEEGLTGSIDLQVKLLDVNNIIVVTVRDAFLDDEKTILAHLSTAVGYDVKVLRSAVISDDIEDANSRKKRDVLGLAGASLQLYIYGLIEREPVDISRLITDINDNAVATINIASTLSLEDHLEGQEISVVAGRDVGLLVSTIVLSIVLFILIVLIVLWVFRKRIWRQKYVEFSDENSLASGSESLSQPPKPENTTKPRLNIEELKRSERRLQEMLDAPIRDVVVEPTTAKQEAPLESKVDMTRPDPRAPIVIQSIDKLKDGVDESSSDDEFGERERAKRKSVVTFNENVEKIIHVEDNEDINAEADYEVYKL